MGWIWPLRGLARKCQDCNVGAGGTQRENLKVLLPDKDGKVTSEIWNLLCDWLVCFFFSVPAFQMESCNFN